MGRKLFVRPCAIVAAVILAVLATSSAQAGLVTSTFDTDADGWTTFQNPGAPFGWIAAGGNPGGHIGATDKGNDWGYAQAPSKFLLPGAYNGVFSFDLKIDAPFQPAGFPGIFSVRTGLQGGGLILINESGLPTTGWQNYSFTLNELSGWRVFSDFSQFYTGAAPLATLTQVNTVLNGLTRIVIATDYTYASLDGGFTLPSQVDRTYLDNVTLSTAEPVPQPSSLVLLSMGGCLTVLGAARRRLCKTATTITP